MTATTSNVFIYRLEFRRLFFPQVICTIQILCLYYGYLCHFFHAMLLSTQRNWSRSKPQCIRNLTFSVLENLQDTKSAFWYFFIQVFFLVVETVLRLSTTDHIWKFGNTQLLMHLWKVRKKKCIQQEHNFLAQHFYCPWWLRRRGYNFNIGDCIQIRKYIQLIMSPNFMRQ